MKLIDKDKLEAFLNELIENLGDSDYDRGYLCAIDSIFGCYLNSLEVKEVGLQSEIDRVWDNTSDAFLEDGWKEFEDIAKHFFELGLNANNQLTWEDIKILQEKSSEVFAEVAKGKDDFYSIYPTEQSFLEEVLKRYKAQKGE